MVLYLYATRKTNTNVYRRIFLSYTPTLPFDTKKKYSCTAFTKRRIEKEQDRSQRKDRKKSKITREKHLAEDHTKVWSWKSKENTARDSNYSFAYHAQVPYLDCSVWATTLVQPGKHTLGFRFWHSKLFCLGELVVLDLVGLDVYNNDKQKTLDQVIFTGGESKLRDKVSWGSMKTKKQKKKGKFPKNFDHPGWKTRFKARNTAPAWFLGRFLPHATTF